MAKYIFITGGVVSSLGKGITAASIGHLLKSRGLKVSMQKFDPYLNVDPGTLSPYQHGEVFVTDDGAETDLDLGHYERFIDEPLNKYASISTGKIYKEVMEKERAGEYGGKTVQVIPHITNAIKDKLFKVAETSSADVVITEIGGTVGDIESLPFLEAIRQARRDLGYKNTLYIHNTLVPYLKAAKEIKTKPTQHSVKELMSLGIHPDMIVLRSDVEISEHVKEKIALFCDVSVNNIFEVRDVEVLYEVVINLKNQSIDKYILEHFEYNDVEESDTLALENLINKINQIDKSLTIGIIGKYVELKDAYLSVIEALKHSGYVYDRNIDIKWINADNEATDKMCSEINMCDAIVIPGGFGSRGTKGIINAIKYLKKSNIPTLAIGMGMQLMVVEYFQNELLMSDAHSAEINEGATHKIFELTSDTENIFSSPIRLGLYDVLINEKTKLYDIYETKEIKERHRNRFEFNNDYLEQLKSSNLLIAATSKNNNYIEAIEIKDHNWFIGVLYHPEFLSRPLKAHTLFNSLINAAIKDK